jgi:hypothetical protein
MKKDAWEKLHNFMKSEHTCSWCKHCEATEKDRWTTKFDCTEKRKDGAGSSAKGSYECDLWEHR